MDGKEVSWESIFARPKPKIEMHFAKKCACGNGNCRTAKRILCKCSCHNVNHGAANRVGMEPLDKVLGFEAEEAVLRLDPQISRELIYID